MFGGEQELEVATEARDWGAGRGMGVLPKKWAEVLEENRWWGFGSAKGNEFRAQNWAEALEENRWWGVSGSLVFLESFPQKRSPGLVSGDVVRMRSGVFTP